MALNVVPRVAPAGGQTGLRPRYLPIAEHGLIGQEQALDAFYHPVAYASLKEPTCPALSNR